MLLETLQRANPRAELWWDSLPTAYAGWADSVVAQAPAGSRAAVAERLKRFYAPEAPDASLVQGATSNPRLLHAGLVADPARWNGVLETLLAARPMADDEALAASLAEEVYRQNAALLQPLWARTDGRHGWVCAQLPPALVHDAAAMRDRGLALARLAPNLMVKVPGSAAGFAAMADLSARGVSLNVTFSFSVAQAEAAIAAIRRGHDVARREGVDLSRWRAVFTFMAGRFGAEPELARQAASHGLRLTPQDVRWAEVAIARRLSATLAAAGHPLKLLLCSLQLDDWGDGPRCLHLEANAHADCVFTFSPPALAGLLGLPGVATLDAAVADAPVPPALLDQLAALPYFRACYAPGGITPAAFADHPAFQRAQRDAALAHTQTLEMIRARRAP
jgi:transaldolase